MWVTDMGIHGGDIYRNHVTADFSVNVNPLETPESVKAALYKAVNQCGRYPDIEAEKLKKAVGRMVSVPEEAILLGNGASELFMAVIHGIRPKKTVIPVPSFYGYEYAAKAAGSEICDYGLKPEEGFGLTEDIFGILTEEADLLFLANPNNPTGVQTEKEWLRDLLQHCRKKGIYVVLDECFIEFCASGHSMISELDEFGNLILVRAFTKIFSIPGVRLGYLLCKNRTLLPKIAGQLPEWNLSCFAQEAGCACAKEIGFIRETEKYIEEERAFLAEGFRKNGFLVFPSMANFILVYRNEAQCESTLYEQLLRRGILIRNCENFKGLCRGYYRIAVKNREENERLLEAVRQEGAFDEEHRICAAGRD